MAGERSIEFEFLLRRYSFGDLVVFGIDPVIALDTVTKRVIEGIRYFGWI